MDSVAEVWKSILEIIARDITPTAYNTWFADCEPVELEDCKLVLHTVTDFKRNIIQSRFGSTICAALYDLFSCDFELQVLAGDELEEYLSRKKGPDHLPEMDGYTLTASSSAPRTSLPTRRPWPWRKTPARPITPSSSTATPALARRTCCWPSARRYTPATREKEDSLREGRRFHQPDDTVRAVRHGGGVPPEIPQRGPLPGGRRTVSAGKQATQEEFFHTFNNIYEAGHQIVITSDRPPLEMSLLDDRLRTRFEGGLMADVQPPDIETRMAIIRNKAAQLGMILPDDVVEYIGENITANIRQIEGVVKRLTAYKEILNDTITINSVKRAIKDVIRVGEYIPTPDVIIEETARYYSLSPDDLRGQRRSKNIAMARQISMYLMRSLTNLSLLDIGEQYEGRNHSTVLSSVRQGGGPHKKRPRSGQHCARHLLQYQFRS